MKSTTKSKNARVARTSVVKETPNILEEQIESLHRIIPEAFSESKVDFEKLRAILGETIDTRPERFTFAWAGKRNAIQILQMPTRATLIPARNESVDFDNTKNLFIEGDNLEVMKLLYKAYFGKVKVIYIDPPYNTGNDFVYPDNYADPLHTYLKITGQKDTEGNLLTSNPETSGRFHSTWLSMVYPRLFLARQLLSDDGSVWMSIDDTEVANLREICNEVFGEENFVATFLWEKRTTRENRRVFSFNTDYILCYAKNKDLFQASRKMLPLSKEVLDRYSNPDNDPRGDWQSVSLNAQAGHATPNQFYTIKTPGGRALSAPPGRCWSVTKPRMDELIRDKRVWFGKSGNNVPRLKVFLSEAEEGLTPQTLWTAEEVGTNDSAKKALIELFSGKDVYDTPKPVGLIKRIVQVSTASSHKDLVLDFFAGSCPTAQSVLELNRDDGGNRHFIMIQLQEPTPEDSSARKAGYENIAEIGKERIRRVIARMKREKTGRLDPEQRNSKEDTGFRVFELDVSNYKPWKGVGDKTAEAYAAEMETHIESLVDGWKKENVIYEVAIKEGFGLTSNIEQEKKYEDNEVWRVSDFEKEQTFLICLDNKIKTSTIRSLGLTKDNLFVCRDTALDDTGAANLALQCNLKTI
jgi:adenine-specific DNA-methyltransferase